MAAKIQETSKQEDNMIVDREFDQETAEQLKVVPLEPLKAFLKAQTVSTEPQENSEPSKWAKVAAEIEASHISHATGKHILNCIEEFRNDEGV